MYKSLLSKDFLGELQQQLSMVNKLCNAIQKSLEKSPVGRLRMILQGKNKIPRFYHVKEKYSRGVYLNKDHQAVAKRLAQKEYNTRLLSALSDIQLLMSSLAEILEKTHLDGIYRNLPALQNIITPFRPERKTFVKTWLEKKYVGRPFLSGDLEYYTVKGLCVRSKSESFIAETLDSMKIPYRYEYPHKINGNKVFPDFTCLNVRTGEEVIWEHFGLVEKEAYAETTVKKINSFVNEGYILGRNFIFTMETSQQPLTTALVMKIAKQYLL